MKSSVLIALVGAMFWALAAMPANAQATRTFVSGTGDDANPCSRIAPCLTFAMTLPKTAVGGEIDCLDPGEFDEGWSGTSFSTLVISQVDHHRL